METIREDIKSKLLKMISDSADSDEVFRHVVTFREFVTALRIEAETLEEEEYEKDLRP